MFRDRNSASKISKSSRSSLWGVGRRVLLVDSCESLAVGSSCKDDRWCGSIENAPDLPGFLGNQDAVSNQHQEMKGTIGSSLKDSGKRRQGERTVLKLTEPSVRRGNGYPNTSRTAGLVSGSVGDVPSHFRDCRTSSERVGELLYCGRDCRRRRRGRKTEIRAVRT
jgi:hypothetical protein